MAGQTQISFGSLSRCSFVVLPRRGAPRMVPRILIFLCWLAVSAWAADNAMAVRDAGIQPELLVFRSSSLISFALFAPYIQALPKQAPLMQDGTLAAMPDHTHMDMDHMQMDMGSGMGPGHEHHHHNPGPPASLVRFLLIATLAMAAGLVLYVRRSLGRSAPKPAPRGKNLLELPWIGKFLRSRAFLVLLIAPTLLVFLFIVLAGFYGEQNTGNPAVLLTWILWWPAVIFTFFLVGRIWCVACPFGFLGDLAQKIFSLRWKIPGIFKNMWWRLGLFLTLTWVSTLWALDRWPRGTAWLALGITLGAIALGLVFQKRAFCRYVCPVGGVFGLYSMTAPLRISVKDPKTCQQECSEKNCYSACAWFQFPSTLDRNAECSLCMDCVRACPHDNIALRTQSFGADLSGFQPHRKSLDEASAIAAVLGVAFLQTVVMLNAWPEWETKIGSWLHLAPGRLLYTIIFLGVGVIAPALLLALVSYFSRARGKWHSGLPFTKLLGTLRTYAYCFLPLGLALHAAHNFHHLFGEGSAMWSGLRNAVAQYTGWAGLAAGESVGDPPGPSTLFVLQWVALMAGLCLAVRVAISLVRRTGPQLEGSGPEADLSSLQAFRTVLPILLFATAYTVLNLLVLSAAMGHRH